MASSYYFYVLLFSLAVFLFLRSYAAKPLKPAGSTGIHLPIRKNNTSLQYYTTVEMGSGTGDQVNIVKTIANLIIDLRGQFLWLNCDKYNSKSYRPIRCGSTKCKAAKGSGCVADGFGEDVMSVYSTDGYSVIAKNKVSHFPFSCAASFLLEGLASGTNGMIGLARTQTSLPTQIAYAFKLPHPHKFALWIPSSNKSGLGDIFICDGPYYMLPTAKIVSESLTTTPLLINPGVDGTKLRTIAPYTTLHTSIYKALVSEFFKKAATKKMKRVMSVAPFGACFSSKTIASTKTGLAVPAIYLVLQKASVYWRIYGANSMVKVKKDVLCLGFVDGGSGSKPRTSIVVGGHQMENYLLEFDTGNYPKLGFSSSLLLLNASCSHFRIF
ncbi:eukaryotic aspartyl protease family protein [Actinidia rufa]|uniref:Eukaryotic aspartyl protease family protein n=1 Tax=Actinidia rufa TaxID=165716 RepID=A0A7J0GNG2_9ERIC|nr:eukaryotic aspartyl protease family protein [Actinidia rufa]